jgi:hypothetical protein
MRNVEGQKACLLDGFVAIVETAIQEFGVPVDQVIEADEHVADQGGCVGPNDRIF